MKLNKAFIASQLITGATVLFYVLLFRHLGNIYTALNSNELGALENLTEEKAELIQKRISETLDKDSIERSLYRYFVFFYLDNYTEREVFISKSDVALSNPNQPTDNDPFYVDMLTYHTNNICFLKNTTDISKSSVVYKNLESNNEISPDIFYLSCPIFVNDTLVGYIGGLNNKKDGSISVETAAVRNAAAFVTNILETKKNAGRLQSF